MRRLGCDHTARWPGKAYLTCGRNEVSAGRDMDRSYHLLACSLEYHFEMELLERRGFCRFVWALDREYLACTDCRGMTWGSKLLLLDGTALSC